MQKGSFKCRSFHFTGDGRNQLNDGTAAGSNGITVNNMAISILCNAAACFIESGEWVEDSSMLSGAATMTIRTNTISFLTYSYTADYSQPTTPYVYYTYLKRAGISDYASAAKIMLMYQATKGMAGINTLTGGNSNFYVHFQDWTGSSSPMCCCDLTMLYLPPSGGVWENVFSNYTAKNFKLLSLQYYNSWSKSYPLSCNLTSGRIYGYHILTSGDTVGIFLTSDEWLSNKGMKGFVIGDVLEESSLSIHDTSNLRKFAGFSTFTQRPSSEADNISFYSGAGFSSYYGKYWLSDQCPMLCNYGSNPYGVFPWTQFFTTEGNLCSCTTQDMVQTNGQAGVWIFDNYLLACLNQHRTDEQLLHTAPVGIGLGPVNSSYMRVPCVDPITGSCYKGQFQTNFLLTSGCIGLAVNAGNSNPMFPRQTDTGTLFDNGNYIHLGAGIWMGWHPDNGSIFTNTGDEMVVYNPAS